MAIKWNPEKKIELLKLLERTIDDKRIRDALRPTMAESQFKKLFGQRVVDLLVERAKDGKGKDGPFSGTYSKTYRESEEFQIYKAGQKKIDLTLTGEMLESLKFKQEKYSVVINLQGQENRNKAEGHISGLYGKAQVKPRNFMELPDSVLNKVFLESIKDYRDLTKLTLTELSI